MPLAGVRSGCIPVRDESNRARGATAGRRRGCPDFARFVVTDIDDLGRAVANRIVGPLGQLVFTAVLTPGVAAAVGRDLKPEVGLATTLIHGAGVFAPSESATYSRPSAANPPMPLKYSRSGLADGAGGCKVSAPRACGVARFPSRCRRGARVARTERRVGRQGRHAPPP